MDITRNIQVDEHYTITSEVVGKDNNDKLTGFGMGVVTGRTITQQPISKAQPKPITLYIARDLTPAEQWKKKKKDIADIESRVKQALAYKTLHGDDDYVRSLEKENQTLQGGYAKAIDEAQQRGKASVFQKFKIIKQPQVVNELSMKKVLGVQTATVFRNADQIQVEHIVRKQKKEMRTDLKTMSLQMLNSIKSNDELKQQLELKNKESLKRNIQVNLNTVPKAMYLALQQQLMQERQLVAQLKSGGNDPMDFVPVAESYSVKPKKNKTKVSKINRIFDFDFDSGSFKFQDSIEKISRKARRA